MGDEVGKWWEPIWAEKKWQDDALPVPPTQEELEKKPEITWPPKELGALLLRYARTGKAVATQKNLRNIKGTYYWEGFNFSNAFLGGVRLEHTSLEMVNLRNAYLEGAHLIEVNLEQADLMEAYLGEADLIGANLNGAELYGAYLERAVLFEAKLEGAHLLNANLKDSDLEHSSIERTNLSEADLTGANFGGATGTPSDRRGARISSETIANSGWDLATVLEWRRAGAIITDYENLPEDLRRGLERNKEGLTLYFSRPLSRGDRFLIDGVIVSLLGRETDCEVVEYVTQGEGSLLRLQASSADDLVAVAKTLHEELWRQHTPSLRSTVQIPALPSAGLRNELSHVAQTIDQPRSELWVQEAAALQQRNLEAELQRIQVRDVQAASVLSQLLMTLFSNDELREWLSGFPQGAQILPGITEGAAPRRQVAREAAEAIQRQGEAAVFFARLREARSARCELIEATEGRWAGIHTPLLG